MQLNRPYRKFLVALATAFTLTGSVAWADAAKEKELIAVLKSDAAPGEKAITCKKLAVYGSSECVSEVAKLLPVPELSSWARITLEAIPGKEASAALRDASEKLEGRLLIGAINSIGVRRDADAVETLTKRLGDKDVDVAAAAAVALGHIGNDAAAKTLRGALASAPATTKSSVAEGCVLAAEHLLNAGKTDDAIAIYDEVRKSDVAKPRIIEATRGAILARKAEGLPMLVTLLRSPDKSLFNLGLTVAREFPGKDIDQALSAELAQASPSQGALLIAAMADRPATVDAAAIQKAAASSRKPTRTAAIKALAQLGNESAFDTLLAGANDEDAEVAAAAKEALADLPGKKVDAKISELLATATGKSYAMLLDLAGKRRIDATPVFVKALSSNDPVLRRTALVSLGETVDLKGLPILITQATAPKNAEEGAVAQQALKTASVRMPDRDGCAATLGAAIDKGSPEAKTMLLEILAEVGGQTALKTVGNAAKSKDPLLQDVGSRVLGKWSTVDAAPVLLELAQAGPAPQYRIRALRGYIGLARKFKELPEQERADMCQKAMATATQVAEQKLVIDVLKIHPSVSGLRIVAKAHDNPELRADAKDAAAAIVKKVGDKPEVKEILTKAGIEIK